MKTGAPPVPMTVFRQMPIGQVEGHGAVIGVRAYLGTGESRKLISTFRDRAEARRAVEAAAEAPHGAPRP